MDESQDALMMTKPLVRFSIYTQTQVECLQRLSGELSQLLDEDGGLGSNFQEIYGKFWLWILGSYEVSRTMCEYKQCFSERLNTDVSAFKKRVSILRIPFAKQQFQQKHKRDKHPINAEASVCGFNPDTKDMAFEVEGVVLWMRVLFAEFDGLIQSVSHADVFCDLRVADS